MGRDFRRGEVAHHSLLKRLPIVWFSLSFHTSPVSRIEPWPICRRSSMPFGMSLAIRISWPNASRGTKGKQCHGFSLVENPSLSHVWEKSLKKGSNRLTKVTLIAQIWYVICDVNCHHTHRHILYACLFNQILHYTIMNNFGFCIQTQTYMKPQIPWFTCEGQVRVMAEASLHPWHGWSKLTSMTHPIW